jgi:UDP-galactopyranose mutase
LFDYLIVGAGFAGSVLAERLARGINKRVLICDVRPHIGGNAYDYYNEDGILIHKYGPHIFHTKSKNVFDYLSRFTAWRPYQHRVKAYVDGMLVPIPINLDTINQIYGLSLSAFEVEAFLESLAEPREHIHTSEDVVVGKVGRDLYKKFFQGYTRKQWGLDPSELDASVTARVPTRTNRDDRYFTDTYQAMPLHGYTRMFECMLDHPNIKVMLNTNYREIVEFIPYHKMIYTGPIDGFFDYQFGKLPYRSLHFVHETHNIPVYQPAPVVNYPNDYAYTRITEFKYLTGQEHRKTSIVYEYPQAEGDPYYPVPRPENTRRYEQYKALANVTPGVYFVGRLATYKYYNIDQVVAQALKTYRTIREQQLENAEISLLDVPLSGRTRVASSSKRV